MSGCLGGRERRSRGDPHAGRAGPHCSCHGQWNRTNPFRFENLELAFKQHSKAKLVRNRWLSWVSMNSCLTPTTHQVIQKIAKTTLRQAHCQSFPCLVPATDAHSPHLFTMWVHKRRGYRRLDPPPSGRRCPTPQLQQSDHEILQGLTSSVCWRGW